MEAANTASAALRILLRDGQVAFRRARMSRKQRRFSILACVACLALVAARLGKPGVNLTFVVLALAGCVSIAMLTWHRTRGVYSLDLGRGAVTNRSRDIDRVIVEGDKIGAFWTGSRHVLRLESRDGDERNELFAIHEDCSEEEKNSLKAIALLVSQRTPAELTF